MNVDTTRVPTWVVTEVGRLHLEVMALREQLAAVPVPAAAPVEAPEPVLEASQNGAEMPVEMGG